MFNPNQFRVNEAWIAFQLNEAPIMTDRDGDFNIIALMDAASCFVLGSEYVKSRAVALTRPEAKRLLQAGYDHNGQYPSQIIVPRQMAADALVREAQSDGIAVTRESERDLQVFLSEVRVAFRAFIGQGRVQ